MAQHGMCELTVAIERRHVGDLPAFGFFRLPHRVPRRLLSEAYQSQMQVASVVNCWTSCSDISSYHADYHEGHGTVRAAQGCSMAWAQHAMCELAFIVHSDQQNSIGVIFRTSRTGSDVGYSYHHISSRFSFPIFACSWCFSVFHSLNQSHRIYIN